MIGCWWKKLNCAIELEKINIASMTILPNQSQYQCNPYQATNGIFHRIRTKKIPFVWKHKRPCIAKTMLRKKNRAGGIRLSDFTLYSKATVIKTVQHWHRNRYMHQWSSIESPERNPCAHGQLIYDQGGRNIQLRKDNLFSKGCSENWMASCERMKLEFSNTTYKYELKNGLKA